MSRKDKAKLRRNEQRARVAAKKAARAAEEKAAEAKAAAQRVCAALNEQRAAQARKKAESRIDAEIAARQARDFTSAEVIRRAVALRAAQEAGHV